MKMSSAAIFGGILRVQSGIFIGMPEKIIYCMLGKKKITVLCFFFSSKLMFWKKFFQE